ncbi:DNA-binding protein, partial [Shigella sonnei]
LMPFYFRKECPLNSGYLTMQRVLAFYQGKFQEAVL